MLSNTLRSNFLKFYANRNHTPVASSPVFPHNDPSILFTNAGMNQFKNIFLGKEQTSYTRATTSQKCIRAGGKHNDLENVGHTSRHLTFFEMLGNFSFGDYFKQDAISFAWEVSLSVFNFDPDFIYATVHEKDDEAFALWEKYLPTDKIFRLTDKDNFWSMADTGPCGFCSELLFDRGEKFGKAASPLEDVDGERFLEYWNLVFMEFNRASDGTLLALQKKCVDTGAGLERLVSLLAETETVFEADVLRHLIAKVENLSGTTYSPTESKGAAFRVIADHIRSLSFAIADGLLPGNTERGYVLRKILRRAVNYGKRLGFHRPFLAEVVPSLIETMGEAYPELQASETQIQEVLTTEEEHFFKTLQRGGNLLQQVLKSSASSAKISGEDAFKLIDEIALLAKDHDYTVDMETFEKLEMEAKERSRKNTAKTTSDSNSIFLDLDPTNTSEFVGYHMLSCDTFIEGIVKYNEIATTLEEGEEGEIILRTTPFYAEKGGQIGDSGEIFCESGTFLVSHTTTPKAGLIVHHGKLSQGSLQTTMAVTAQVNQNLRKKIANNHTGCHLLHKALEITLGEHIRQAGSYVDSKKIRLDFTHNKALSPEDLLAIETIVNEKIRENDPVTIREALYSDVMGSSEIKQFFGDKYGDVVRVVSAGFSHELCGGTHAQATGDIGYFRITKEHAVATGIRRIEATTGEDAETLAREQDADLNEIASVIQSPKDQILVKIRNVIEEKRELAKQVADLENQLVQQHVKSLLPACDKIDETLYLGYLLTEEEGQRIQQYANALHKEIPANCISLWVTEKSGRYIVLIRVSDDLIKRGIHAQTLLEELLAPYGGRCGGKAISAQGSSKELPPIEVLNKTLRQWISTRLV